MQQVYIVTSRNEDDPKFTLREIWSVFDSSDKACAWIEKMENETNQYHMQIWDVK